MDAIVLSGGAAYGAYEVGVLKALHEKQGFDPEIITGTSVGAYNAAILAGDSIGRLEEVWRTEIPEQGLRGNGVFRIRGNPMSYLGPKPPSVWSRMFGDTASLARSIFDRSGAFLVSRGGPATRLSEFVDISAFLSCEPLHRTIARTVSLERIRNSTRKLLIIATDWQNGVPRIFENQDMTDADGESVILASTAIPGIFPPVSVQGTIYVDGGVVMNTPLKPAIQAGADDVHVISAVPPVSKIDPDELDNSLEAMIRVLQIHLAGAIREDAATAAWINAGMDAMDRVYEGGEIESVHVRDFLRVAGQIRKAAERGARYRRLTIHHYHPQGSLGEPTGLLDFRRPHIEYLIERGYQDASRHVCSECGCIVPAVSDQPFARSITA